jgi:hypothetical protein
VVESDATMAPRRLALAILLVAATDAACASRTATAPHIARSLVAPAIAPPGKVIVERTTKTGATYRYTFVREVSPVKTTLRSVLVLTASSSSGDIRSAAEQPVTLAVAVGDDGVVLERDVDGTWKRTRTDTHQRLNAWCGRRIVGAHGTILSDRGAEATDITSDLADCESRFAVGSAGTIVAHAYGERTWTSVSSPTNADLRALWEGGTNCMHAPGDPPPLATLHAFGRGGAIVRCTFAECYPDDRPTTCENQPSPTSADLNAFGIFMTRALRKMFVVGAHGTVIQEDENDDHWVATQTTLNADLRAAAPGYDLGVDANGASVTSDPIVVGDKCTAAFLDGFDGAGPLAADPIPLGCGIDLFGASASGLHVFFVGGEGTIWHGTVDGITVPRVIFEPDGAATIGGS